MWVSKDERVLMIRNDKGPRFPMEIDTSTIIRLQDGHGTPVWESHTSGCCCFGGNNNIDPSICFSICTSDETVDLRAESLQAKQAYYEALEAFISIRKSTTGEFIESQRKAMEEKQAQKEIQERDEKKQLIAKKYSEKRAMLGKKYNVS
uniref:Uncharacterized protein n=1 Tax=Arcella intermedia TaxID=1963864 RepID=A0A6B2LGV4_9EUKA